MDAGEADVRPRRYRQRSELGGLWHHTRRSLARIHHR